MIQLLTATGARPEAFALCARWMRRQDYAGPVSWIIVDDGEPECPPPEMPAGWSVGVVRPAPRWRLGDNTQARNLLAGLEVASDRHPLFVIEDDDWYAPDYLSAGASWLKEAPLVGEGKARYYNVATRRAQGLNNMRHASLCATIMDGSMLAAFRSAIHARQKFIDLELWRAAPHSRVILGSHRCVGMKGLPGRGGIGMGHSEAFGQQSDTDGSLLRAWVGTDAEVYLEQFAQPA